MAARLLRSVLYVPAINAKAVAKARTLDVDAVILDLEDAVAPQSKSAARSLLPGHLSGNWGHRRVAVRVNGAGTPWHAEDLTLSARLPCEAIVLPKVEAPKQVTDAAAWLSQANPGVHTPIWAMIETPIGVLNVVHIANAARTPESRCPLECLVAGTSDLTAALGARHVPGRQPLLTSLSAIVLAARAHGLLALDGVCLQVPGAATPAGGSSSSGSSGALPSTPPRADPAAAETAAAAFLEECTQGRALGFHGKTLIHPAQVPGANEAFGPSKDEVAAAGRIVAAYDAALGRGEGVVVVDGRLIEALHVAVAKETLSLARDVAARLQGVHRS